MERVNASRSPHVVRRLIKWHVILPKRNGERFLPKDNTPCLWWDKLGTFSKGELFYTRRGNPRVYVFDYASGCTYDISEFTHWAYVNDPNLKEKDCDWNLWLSSNGEDDSGKRAPVAHLKRQVRRKGNEDRRDAEATGRDGSVEDVSGASHHDSEAASEDVREAS